MLISLSIILIIFGILCLFFSGQSTVMSEKQSVNVVAEQSKPPLIEKNIVTYKGSQYDITDFIRKHPGGKAILIQNNGKDIEQLMLENEHSAHAYELLEKYKIRDC